VQIRKGFISVRPSGGADRDKAFLSSPCIMKWRDGGGCSEWLPRWLPPLRPHFPLVRYKHDAIMFFIIIWVALKSIVRALATSSNFFCFFFANFVSPTSNKSIWKLSFLVQKSMNFC
jgi:hypothetical protein